MIPGQKILQQHNHALGTCEDTTNDTSALLVGLLQARQRTILVLCRLGSCVGARIRDVLLRIGPSGRRVEPLSNDPSADSFELLTTNAITLQSREELQRVGLQAQSFYDYKHRLG